MYRRLAQLDRPLARALLVVLPLAVLATIVALADEPSSGGAGPATVAVAGAEPTATPTPTATAGASAGIEAETPSSARIRSLLRRHNDQQALLYGRSAPGAEFVVYANNVECARDTADENGWWVVAVAEAAPCAPSAGAILWIARDSEFLARAQVWNPGSRSVGDGIEEDAPAGTAQEGLAPPEARATN